MNRLFSEEKKNCIVKWSAIVVWIFYLGFNLYLLLHHTPYRDEANVWLMARELSPIGLIREIHYQGHPCLWYFLVMPFAKLGFPYRTIEVLSFLIMGITGFLILMKTEINLAVKAFFVVSPFCTYFYPVIARNYCLIALLMVLLSLCYEKRNEKPVLYGILLALLVQADTIAIAAAGAISLAWLFESLNKSLKEKDKSPFMQALKGLWMPLFSLLFWVYQMRGVSDCTAYEIRYEGMANLLKRMRDYTFYIFIRLTGWRESLLLLFLVVIFAAMIFISVKTKKIVPLLTILFAFAFQVLFSAMVYELHIWHFLSLGFVWIYAICILEKERRKQDICDKGSRIAAVIVNLAVVILAIGMINHWNSDAEISNLNNAVHKDYSDGGKAAAFIRENIDKDALIISTDVAMDSSVLVYLKDYSFRYAANGNAYTYATWSAEQLEETTFAAMDDRIRNEYKDLKEYYVIVSDLGCITDKDALDDKELVYKTKKKTTKNENYRIYRVVLD